MPKESQKVKAPVPYVPPSERPDYDEEARKLFKRLNLPESGAHAFPPSLSCPAGRRCVAWLPTVPGLSCP